MPARSSSAAGTISATFEDQRFDVGGNLIAVTGLPGKPLDNDWGFYGIIDQLIWRLPGSEEAKGVALFGRVIGAPSDRNLIDFYVDGGIHLLRHDPEPARRLLRHRLRLYRHLRSGARLRHRFGAPVARNYEALLEICYTMQLATGWTLQPDFQYIWQPGGNVPTRMAECVENAAVFGARSTISF